MPSWAFWLRSCQLFTNWVMTRVNVPATTAMPPIITIAVANERCSRTRLRSQLTTGESRADRSNAMETGTTT
jgi:hypothetical protein